MPFVCIFFFLVSGCDSFSVARCVCVCACPLSKTWLGKEAISLQGFASGVLSKVARSLLAGTLRELSAMFGVARTRV